jgi:hypothetical protein
MIDEMFWLRLLEGGFGSGVDLAAVLAFVVFAVVAFLSPVIGYEPRRSTAIPASLFLLIAYVGVSVIQLIFQWTQMLDGPGRGFGRGGGDMGVHLLIGFAVFKMMLFLAAMLTFAIGVLSLRVRRDEE